MTNKNRGKECAVCECWFVERKADSDKQWVARAHCSIKCSNSSKDRVTHIYERLERFQIKSSVGCWEWSGGTDSNGYGSIASRKGSGFSNEKAHRVAYEKCHGEIPEGLNICHSCDNPPCTKPSHLFAATQLENMRDMANKGRMNPISLKNLNHNKILTEDKVREISGIKFKGRNGRGPGETVQDVAKRYGVCRDLITAIKYNRY